MSQPAFDIGDAFRRGWEVVRARLGFFVGALMLSVVLVLVPEALGLLASGGGDGSAGQGMVMVAAGLVVMLVGMLLFLGWIRIGLRSLDGKEVGLADLFGEAGVLIRYLGAWILFTLAVGVGYLLLVVPGIYLSVKYGLFPFYLVERDMGPVEALKASGRAVEGSWWRLFGFIAAAGILNTAAGFTVVGLLVSYPVTLVAWAWVYRRLAATAESAGPSVSR